MKQFSNYSKLINTLRDKFFLPVYKFVLPGFTLLTLLVVGIMVVLPWLQDVREKKDKIVETRNKTDDVLVPKREQLLDLREDDLRKQLLSLELVLPSFLEMPRVFSTIEAVAAESAVSIESLQYSTEQEVSSSDSGTESGSRVAFTFVLAGEIDVLAGFVKNLERTAPLMNISSLVLSLSEQEGEEAEKQESAVLQMATFFTPLLEEVGGVDEALDPLDQIDRETLLQLVEFKSYIKEVEEVEEKEEGKISVPLGKENPF